MIINVEVKPSKKLNTETSAFLSFPYDEKILGIIRSFPRRFWHPETKQWEIPVENMARIKNFVPTITFNVTDYINIYPEKKCVKTQNKQFKTRPYNHQIEGYEYGLNHRKWLLCDEQGLGKTWQAINIATELKNLDKYNHCLIICGVNGLKWNWQAEIEKHSNEKGYILGQRFKKGKIYIGSTQDKIDDLIELQKQNTGIQDYFIITNIESIRNVDICNNIKKMCSNGIINMCVFDEVHLCKNPTSQQGKALLEIQPEYRLGMTGTPLMNTPLDLYVPLKWLGIENHTFYAFKNHYTIQGGFGNHQVVGYKNLEELKEVLDEIMLRRLKSDVLDLPEKTFINEYVDMSSKQSKVYNEIYQTIKQDIDKIKVSNNPLAQLIRLRQATGHTSILSTTVSESAKIERLKQLIDEHIQNGQKVVVFSNWKQMVDIVDKEIKDYSHIVITGDTKDNERQMFVDWFQKNDKIKVALGTCGAMGTGITLTAGTVVIFLDEPWTMASKNQCIDRCHRIGTSNNITVYTLLCKGTIDERVHDIVSDKGAMADMLVDGRITKNQTQLLDFLLS